MTTKHGSMALMADEIGLEDTVMDAGGLGRKVRFFRLPDETTNRSLKAKVEVDLKPRGDNPIWVCAATEDGFQAWSSPIYVFNSPDE